MKAPIKERTQFLPTIPSTNEVVSGSFRSKKRVGLTGDGYDNCPQSDPENNFVDVAPAREYTTVNVVKGFSLDKEDLDKSVEAPEFNSDVEVDGVTGILKRNAPRDRI